MHLPLSGENIPCRIVRSRGRIGIAFRDPEPVLTIQTPDGRLDAQAEAFLKEKAQWILKHYRRRAALYTQRKEFLDRLDGGEVLYMGKWYPLRFAEDSQRWVRVSENEITLHLRPGDQKLDRKLILFEAFRALARRFLAQRTEALARETGSAFNRLTIKHVVSKWGSCSSKRNINLNWHLIFLPQHLIDYIIVHELMHLREMNHSQAYWAWVAKYCPDYKARKAGVQGYAWLINILK